MASAPDLSRNVPLPHEWLDAPAPDVAPVQRGLTDDELLALLQREEEGSSSYRNSILADEQANALDFYDARPFGDEVDGQSQVVTPYVAEVVDYMTISVARTCVSGDRVVEFEARFEDQTDAAQEASEAVSQAFMRDQDGYKVILGWLQSGLVEKIGIVKTACVTKTRLKRSTVRVDPFQLAALDIDGSLLDYTDHPDGGHVARIQQRNTEKRYVDTTVPSEEFLFSSRARHEDDAGYIAQRSRKTRSELVEMMFDQATVAALPSDNDSASWWGDPRSVARWGDEYWSDEQDGALSEVTLLEEYVRADRDGDGIAELLKVFRVADVILDVTEVDEQPFVVFCPFPRAHRMVGDSLAEKVMDLQRIRSVVTRQTIDGVMLSNRPRAQIDEGAIGESTIDDWLTPGPGVLIRTRAGGIINPLTDAFDISQGLAMLQFLAGEGESRTGITRLNQGLDADTLNKTATGTALMQASGQQMEEYVARNFAEALGRLFAKKMRLMIAEADPIMVRMDGQYRQANPAAWDGDMPVRINVGLGSGRKDQRLANWQLLITDQNALKAGGSQLVTDENMYRARDGAIRDMGLGNPNEFYTDPSTLPPQPPAPPQPSPDAIKAQGQALVAQQQSAQAHEQAMAKLQLQGQAQEAKARLDAQDQAHAQGLKEQEAAHKAALAEQQQAAQTDLAVRQQNANAALAEREMTLKMTMAQREHEQRMQHATEAHQAKVAAFRPGGELDK